MYLLYLDASGDMAYPPPIAKSKSRHYILAGLAIRPEKWIQANEKIKQILATHFANKPSMPVEIKYSEVIGKKGQWGFLTDSERSKFTDDLIQVTHAIEPKLFAIVVKKLEHFGKYTTPEPVNLLALRFIVTRFSRFLKRIDDHGIIVYDAETAKSDKTLRNFLLNSRETGLVYGGNPYFNPWAMFRTQENLEKIVESIFFIDSNSSPAVQLADFCANSIFAHFELSKSYRYEKIKDLFDTDGTNPWGLRVWP